MKVRVNGEKKIFVILFNFKNYKNSSSLWNIYVWKEVFILEFGFFRYVFMWKNVYLSLNVMSWYLNI